MADVKNILVFPAGTEIALEIHSALRQSKFVRLFGGTSRPCHAEFIFERCIEDLPFVDEENFVDALNAVIDEYRIDYVYPAHDSVLTRLAVERDKLHAPLVAAETETVEICRSKNKTYAHLAGADYLPRSYKSAEEVPGYPVFIKPSVGQGAEGARRIDDEAHLLEALSEGVEYAICEYLPGREFTVDCFTDRHGKLRLVSPRSRARIRAGISVRSEHFEADERVRAIAEDINRRFSFMGAWFFQLKENAGGEYRLMEVAPRIAGTMAVTRNTGANLPMLTLFTLWGYDVELIRNGGELLLDRAFIARYESDLSYSRVYVDFDDTIVVNGKVNGLLMMFLHQARDKGKELILLTKHAKDIYESLDACAVSPRLFNEIIHIAPQDEKIKYIKGDSIFIDDSFAERIKVSRACHIPVFDLDMVESLLDWRA